MKTINITTTGNIPPTVQTWILPYQGKESVRDTIQQLDEDITFLVKDEGVAHGNLYPHLFEGWLAPRNGENTWSLAITF